MHPSVRAKRQTVRGWKRPAAFFSDLSECVGISRIEIVRGLQSGVCQEPDRVKAHRKFFTSAVPNLPQPTPTSIRTNCSTHAYLSMMRTRFTPSTQLEAWNRSAGLRNEFAAVGFGVELSTNSRKTRCCTDCTEVKRLGIVHHQLHLLIWWSEDPPRRQAITGSSPR
jgi:hypothetical protein